MDEHTRTRLLRAAVNIFDRKGYATSSVREIAESAGVAKPALYYHFGSKEGLLVAILELAARQFSDALAVAVERPGTSRQRIVGLCEDVCGLFEKHVPLVRVAHTVFFGPREQMPRIDVGVFEARLREALMRLITDGQATGEFRGKGPEDMALALMGVIDACAGRQMPPILEPIGRERIRRILDVVFDGFVNERQQ